MDEQKPQEMVPAVNIRYVGIGQLTLFLVSEDELSLIESGGPAKTLLNLAIALLSVGAGSVVALLLSEPPKEIHKFIIVIVLTVVCLVGGFVLLVLWGRFRRDASDAIRRIRLRGIPSVGAKVMEGPSVEDQTQP
jgi:uncharacterized protein YhhL (DUF1145 family)